MALPIYHMTQPIYVIPPFVNTLPGLPLRFVPLPLPPGFVTHPLFFFSPGWFQPVTFRGFTQPPHTSPPGFVDLGVSPFGGVELVSGVPLSAIKLTLYTLAVAFSPPIPVFSLTNLCENVFCSPSPVSEAVRKLCLPPFPKPVFYRFACPRFLGTSPVFCAASPVLFSFFFFCFYPQGGTNWAWCANN